MIEVESKYNEIVEVRGAGLMLGLKTKNNNLLLSKALIKNKLLNVPASDNIIRLVPPLIISNREVDEAIKIIEFTLKEIND